jgi:hypothetical protein
MFKIIKVIIEIFIVVTVILGQLENHVTIDMYIAF